MPTVPKAPTTTGQIGFTPSSPQQIVGVAQAIGGAVEQVGGIARGVKARSDKAALDAQLLINEAQRKQRSAEADAEVVRDLGELQTQAQSDPNFTGSAERFNASAQEMLDGLGERFDEGTAQSARNNGLRLAASMGVGVRNAEQTKFNANARNTMKQLTENYITAAASADSDLAEELITNSFRAALAQSDFLEAPEKTALNERFESGVSSSQALSLLQSDPDTLLELIDDRAIFPGLSEETRVRLQGQALSAADADATAQERLSTASVKLAQDAALSGQLVRFIEGGEGNSREEIRADVVANQSDYSTSGLKTLKEALRESSAKVDDPQTVVNLDRDIRDGGAGVLDAIDAAYINGKITLSTRNSRIRLHDARNEPRSSPFRTGLQLIDDSLGPNPMDFNAPKASAELRASNAIEEFEAYDAAAERTPEQLRAQSRKIVKAYSGGVTEASVRRSPYGSTVPAAEVTTAVLSESDTAIGKALRARNISTTQAALLSENNDALRTIATSNDAIAAAAGDD